MRSRALLSLFTGYLASHTLAGDQVAKLIAPPDVEARRFGSWVTMDQGIALVSDCFNGMLGEEVGAAFLYDMTGPGPYLPLATLVPHDPQMNDHFGNNAAVVGNRALIGAIGHDHNHENEGAAYFFDISDPSSPVLLHEFLAPGAQPSDRFGTSVAIHNEYVLIGAMGDSTWGEDAGAVHVFHTADPTNPASRTKFTSSDVAPDDRFGTEIDTFGNLAAVGVPFADDSVNACGRVYLFDITDPLNPVELARIAPPQDLCGFFGFSIALDAQTLVVGAPTAGSEGLSLIYDIADPAQPVLASQIAPIDDQFWQLFGWNLDAEMSRALIGDSQRLAMLADLSDPYDPVLSLILPDDRSTSSSFGNVLDLDGERAIVGAWGDPGASGPGAAYVFDSLDQPSPCNFADFAQPYHTLDFDDVIAFLIAFANADIAADLSFSSPHVFDFDDVSAFLTHFASGCP